ncbi:NTF2-related export protein 1 isoform X2 [Oratosquilla oratoria]|uniref:NTF2-related export protein 1 isoform X2 n=1 Tax=Oratosquilla oratoria TaxID=337810 RepID=UPI003F75DFDE
MASEVVVRGVSTACTAAESFVDLYYSFMDKMRHKLKKLFLEDGRLVWNGNSTNGAENIQKFYEELPASEHNISCIDSQPVNVAEQSTIMVFVSGFVTFQERKTPFQQTFLITAQDDKWKVVSDCFRFQAPPS